MGTNWEELAEWWAEEVADDPAYREQVLPLLMDLLNPRAGSTYLDAGCGDGRIIAAVREAGATAIGCDLNLELLRSAYDEGPVVSCRLPDLAWVRPDAFDGAYASLVVEHLINLDPFFIGLADAVKMGGPLVLVVNHPLFTAPESGPIVDPTDGEVFWRWGTYLEEGYTEEPAGDGLVTFYHRPMATILNSAADAGWSLERVVELGVPNNTSDPLLAPQGHIPRLLGVRWTRAQPARR